MRIPRRLKSVQGHVISRYGALPFENDQDKEELNLMKGILDAAINEKKIIFRRGNPNPEFTNKMSELEKSAFERIFEHTKMNNEPEIMKTNKVVKDKLVEYVDDSRDREKSFLEKMVGWFKK